MKIYVVTHKKVNNKLPKNYSFMQVNALQNGKYYDYTDADYEDNISLKNPYYCELTAAYSIWKNDHENDVVGLVHYRRFFVKNRVFTSYKHYLSEKQINKDLKKYDFIATNLYISPCTNKDHLIESIHEKDFNLLRNTISEICNEYLETFDKVMMDNKSYLLNMFITKKENWDKYYEWLFKIFDAMEPKVDMTGYTDNEKRLYGFLSERLFTVYVYYHHFKVKSYSCVIVGESKLRILRQKIIKKFKVFKYKKSQK